MERRRRREEEDASSVTLTFDELRERNLKRAAEDRRYIDTGLAIYKPGDRWTDMPQPMQKMLDLFSRGEQEGLWGMAKAHLQQDMRSPRTGVEYDMTRAEKILHHRGYFIAYQKLVLKHVVGPDNVLCCPHTGLPAPIDVYYGDLGTWENKRRSAAGESPLVKSAMSGSADRSDNTLNHVHDDQKVMWSPLGFQFSPKMQGLTKTAEIVKAVFGVEHAAPSEAEMVEMEEKMDSQPFNKWVIYHLTSK